MGSGVSLHNTERSAAAGAAPPPELPGVTGSTGNPLALPEVDPATLAAIDPGGVAAPGHGGNGGFLSSLGAVMARADPRIPTLVESLEVSGVVLDAPGAQPGWLLLALDHPLRVEGEEVSVLPIRGAEAAAGARLELPADLRVEDGRPGRPALYLSPVVAGPPEAILGVGALAVEHAARVTPQAAGSDVEALVRAATPGLRRYARESFPRILAACAKAGITDRAQIAYVLATAQRESNNGQFMHELGRPSYFVKYEPPRRKARELGNTQKGDGARFKGRGYCQITGRRNYTDWTRRLNVGVRPGDPAYLDLVARPELAERPEIAARIIAEGMRDGTFTGRGLGRYLAAGQRPTLAAFREARRIINGQDHAGEVAEAAMAFYRAMG